MQLYKVSMICWLAIPGMYTGPLGCWWGNQIAFQVADRGALPSLISLCAQRGPDNDLRRVGLQCVAALSTQFALKDQIIAEGALPVLCKAAKLRGLSLQEPVAAALANLCSSGALAGAGVYVEDCFLALNVLSQSSNSNVQVGPSVTTLQDFAKDQA